MEVQSNFTEPVIKGEKYTRLLPHGCSLVLEGGGMRGFYSAGVLEAFMDAGIMFPYIIGVSAGAANALSYISGQKGRNRVLIEKYVGTHQYMSRRNMLKYGSLFNFDYMFKTIPERHLFWDKSVYDNSCVRFLTGATDCVTGETVWFEKQDVEPGFDVIRASCSVPLIARIASLRGYTLLDGGISAPVPIEKSLADGNSFHVIVLTRNEGYVKPPFGHKSILGIAYRKYPKLVEAVLNRHDVYNRQIAMCEELEREGKAIIIRPLKPLAVDRTDSDTEKLLRLYDEGYDEGKQAVRRLETVFGVQ